MHAPFFHFDLLKSDPYRERNFINKFVVKCIDYH